MVAFRIDEPEKEVAAQIDSGDIVVHDIDVHAGLLVGVVGGAQQAVVSPVFVIGVISPNHLVVFPVHDFDVWLYSCARVLGNCVDDDAEELLDYRSLDLSLQDILEVLDISLLGGLSHTSPSLEPFPPIICDGLYKILCES